jgi:integrase
VLSLLVGVRTEEVRPLRWKHVHLSPADGTSPHVEVWRSVRRHGDTKTRQSRRTLALPKQVVDVLETHQERQKEEREKAGQEWTEAGLVFATRSGTALAAGNVRRDFRRLLRKAGLPADDWAPRELRHSFVSLLSEHGIRLEDIARVVGHRSTTTTDVVYRKQVRPVITKGATVMDAILDGEGQATQRRVAPSLAPKRLSNARRPVRASSRAGRFRWSEGVSAGWAQLGSNQ